MDELLNRYEAAAKLRIGLRTLDRRLATGELKCYRMGDGPRARIRITEAQLQEYLERHKTPYVQARDQELLARV